MASKILYVSALDENNKLCFANEENKEDKKTYHCPLCSSPMSLKKSGHDGKYCKAPHFSHKPNVDRECKPESVLHYTFKTKLAEILNDYLKEGKEFPFSWECCQCRDTHKGNNLLKKTDKILIEENLKECRPDISLVNPEGKTYIAIEIIVTHKPEDQVIEYCKKEGIIIYQIKLTSEKDLDNIIEIAQKPTILDLCARPKCDKCGKIMHKDIIEIKKTPCSCGQEMLFVDGLTRYGKPHDYEQYARNFAIQNGVNLIKIPGKNHYGSLCTKCNSYIDSTLEVCYDPVVCSKEYYYCPDCEYKEAHPYKFMKCSQCNNIMTERAINIINTKCVICNKPITIALGQEGKHEITPKDFSEEEIKFALENGANIRKVESNFYDKPYYSNVCNNCECQECNKLNYWDEIITSQTFGYCRECTPLTKTKLNNYKEPCPKCGNEQTKRTVIVVETKCYKCNSDMRIAFVRDHKNKYNTIDGFIPNTFFYMNQWQIEFIKRNGVIFDIEKSNNSNKIICKCPTCNAQISENYIAKYWFCKEIATLYPSVYCQNCFSEKKRNELIQKFKQ